MPEISLTFPDGSVRGYDAATTGAALAESISKSLAKKAVAYALDGALRDLSDPLGKSGKVATSPSPRRCGRATGLGKCSSTRVRPTRSS